MSRRRLLLALALLGSEFDPWAFAAYALGAAVAVAGARALQTPG